MDTHFYKIIFDVVPYALLVLDRELRVVICNRSSESFLLKSSREIIGRKLFELISHKDFQNQARTVLQNREAGTKLVELHLNIGKEISKILRATISSLYAEDTETPYCLILLEDITQHTQLEEQLVQSEKLIGMGLLARSIAHEIGNPLSIMASTLQYIQSASLESDDKDFREAMGTVMDSIHQIHTLLRSLSDFTGSKRPQFEFCNLYAILSQLLTFISKEAEIHNISIQKEFEDNIPNCQLDSREVKQLFLNLFKNAIEAMPQGGKLLIRMHLLPKDSSSSEDRICVEVSDNGKGINKIDIQHIFRPFYSTKPKGTGLGLSFCRHVVEEHGGKISIKSQLGKGTTFAVTFPVKQEKEKQV